MDRHASQTQRRSWADTGSALPGSRGLANRRMNQIAVGPPRRAAANRAGGNFEIALEIASMRPFGSNAMIAPQESGPRAGVLTTTMVAHGASGHRLREVTQAGFPLPASSRIAGGF